MAARGLVVATVVLPGVQAAITVAHEATGTATVAVALRAGRASGGRGHQRAGGTDATTRRRRRDGLATHLLELGDPSVEPTERVCHGLTHPLERLAVLVVGHVIRVAVVLHTLGLTGLERRRGLGTEETIHPARGEGSADHQILLEGNDLGTRGGRSRPRNRLGLGLARAGAGRAAIGGLAEIADAVAVAIPLVGVLDARAVVAEVAVVVAVGVRLVVVGHARAVVGSVVDAVVVAIGRVGRQRQEQRQHEHGHAHHRGLLHVFSPPWAIFPEGVRSSLAPPKS